MIRKNSKKQDGLYRMRTWVGVGFMALVAIGIFFYGKTRQETVDIQAYADSVYAQCSTKGHSPSCYDEEIPKLMNRISMEDAFAVTKLIQEKDPKYLYCHVLGHNVSFTETSKDVSKWKDVVTRCPTTFCNNGCQHGALMRRFNAESLTPAQIEQAMPDLMDVCEPRGAWHPTEVERSMCYHGLGHLTMFITNADIPQALNLCQRISHKDDGRMYFQTCSMGVFMTVFQPLEPEDIALVKDIVPKKEGVAEFCEPYTGEAWLSCRSEAWALFSNELETPDGLVSFCSYASDPLGRNKCISTVMNFLTIPFIVNNNNSIEKLVAYCNKLPDSYVGECYKDTAFRLVQIDPRYASTAVGVCKASESVGVGDECYDYLLGHASHSFNSGSPGLSSFCNAFDSKWKSVCTAKNAQ